MTTVSPSVVNNHLRGIPSQEHNPRINDAMFALACVIIVMVASGLYVYEKERRLDIIAQQEHDDRMHAEYPKIFVDAHDNEEDEYYRDFAKSNNKASWEDELPLMARLGDEIQCEMARLGNDKNNKAC